MFRRKKRDALLETTEFKPKMNWGKNGTNEVYLRLLAMWGCGSIGHCASFFITRRPIDAVDLCSRFDPIRSDEDQYQCIDQYINHGGMSMSTLLRIWPRPRLGLRLGTGRHTVGVGY
eukprot:scaffold66966_cov29-Attheya_sp.AAC.2